VNTIDITMTTETQSTFGLPAYGRAFGMSACASTTSVQGIDVPVRDRHVATLVKGAFPGTSVWRPPSC